MPFIDPVPEAEATGATAEMYARARAQYGYLPNMYRVFSHAPEVMDGWATLLGSIRSRMTLRRYELVTQAAARELKSSYCMLAHGSIVLDKLMGPQELAAALDDSTATPLNEQERAIMVFAAKVVRDATSVTRSDSDLLRAHGLTDAEIFDITAAAAVRCFYSKMLDAPGAAPDAVYGEIAPDLRERLVVGRPIAAQ